MGRSVAPRPARLGPGRAAQDDPRHRTGARDTPRAARPYHRRVLPAPALVAVGLVLSLIVLLPAYRLQLAGLSSRSIGAYALCLWLLGFALAIRPGGTRFLIPILLIAYIAPFIAAPDRIARVLRRGRGGEPPIAPPPMKNVTPPSDGPADPT